MSVLDRSARLPVGASTRTTSLASRHERRAAARERHHETGEPAWSDADRHTEPDGEAWVADVAPGTPGHYGSVHTTRRD